MRKQLGFHLSCGYDLQWSAAFQLYRIRISYPACLEKEFVMSFAKTNAPI